MTKKNIKSIKSKLVIFLSLICLSLISGIGLSSFLAVEAIYVKESENINFVFSNASKQSISVNNVTFSPITLGANGFYDADNNTFSTTEYKMKVNITLSSTLTYNAPMKVTLSQENFTEGQFNLVNNPRLSVSSYTNFVYSNPSEDIRHIAYFNDYASNLAFMSGSSSLTMVFNFLITDTSVSNDFLNKVFKVVYENKPTFTLKIEVL